MDFLPEFFDIAPKRVGNNIILTLGDESAKHRLLLCSHIDTVQAAEGIKFYQAIVEKCITNYS